MKINPQYLSKNIPLEFMYSENQNYQQKCDFLTKQPEIRFAGFLDMMGNLVAGSFREDVTPLKNEEERKCS